MKQLLLSRLRLLWVLLLLYVTSCQKDPEPAPDQYLVSSTSLGTFTKDQLTARVATINPLYAALLKYGIRVQKLVYKTKNTDGTEVQASGLVIVPSTSDPLPVISQQHGTIFDDAEAPSYYGSTTEAYNFTSVFASVGFIMVCPDYIGFGASKTTPHPYEHRASLAQASLDLIRAAKEFIAKDKTINWDNRLYLTGYSAGGFATMALYKKIQDEVPAEFNLRAVSCGAGAYDKTSFTKEVVLKKSSGVAQYNQAFLWVLLTYNRVYPTLNRDLSSYFKEPYLTEIKARQQLAQINVSLDGIFTDAFVKGIRDGTDTAFLNALADNNCYDWKPLTPLRLYHGDADQQVFFLNSQNAYDAMQKRGAGETVKFFPLAGKTHVTAIDSYILGSYELFSTVR